MEEIEAPRTTLDTHERDKNDVTYLLSSKVGLGHSSRAVAIAQEMDGDAFIQFATQPPVRNFISENLADGQTGFEFVDLNYDAEMEAHDFLSNNLTLIGALALSGEIVLNDFVLQAIHLRQAPEFLMHNKQMVGIYHTIEACRATTPETQSYIDRYLKIAQCMDHIFLAETKPARRKPYQLQSGTRVIPCEPVIRSLTKDSHAVKTELGLRPNDDFLLIQGGMKGNEALRQLLRTLPELAQGDLKIVLAPYDMQYDQDILENEDVVFIDHRIDGHNVVAASSGVITKPGMQILCEAIGYRVPVLFVDDTDPERQLKLTMVEDVLGDELPFKIDTETELRSQISDWLEHSAEITERFEQIPCEGAKYVAEELRNMQRS